MYKKMSTTLKLIGAGLCLVIAFAFVSTALSPDSALAAGPVDVLDSCNDPGRVCAGTDKGSLNGILKNIINLLLFVIGIISVIMIIIGGFRYATSAGDAGQTKSARDTIIYAVVGLVIAVMSFAIVNFVLARL